MFIIPNLYITASLGIDPYLYSSDVMIRGLIRWTSLHIAINGGVHYGLAEIRHEIGNSDAPEDLQPKEGENITNFDPERHPIPYKTYAQFIYSFAPAICSYFITKTLLFENSALLTESVIASGFGSLIFLQITTCAIDMVCGKYSIVPKWYVKYRILT